jgi:hypothetical protein
MLTIDDVARITKPHADKIIADHRVAEACKALELIIGELGAAMGQRAPSDDRIIAEHIESAHGIALAAWRRLRT